MKTARNRTLCLAAALLAELAAPSARAVVDFWKVGKLNHNKAVESRIDWPKFREDAVSLLDSFGCRYYIKEDLRKAI